MANKKVKIKTIRPSAQLPVKNNGNWYDCFVNEISLVRGDKLQKSFNENVFDNVDELSVITPIKYKRGDVLICSLGFAMELGKGYEAHIIPRSSTFAKKGLILTNSVGLIDSSYCGDEDEWVAVFYATRPGSIKVHDRLVQMTIQKSNPNVDFEEVDSLNNPNRGGYGSTGQ